MKRGIAALAMAVTCGLGLGAKGDQTKADIEKKAGMGELKSPDAHKHLTLVDAYLTSAITNVKALDTLADMALTTKDKPIIDEAYKNLDTAIDKAMTHSKQLREVSGGKAGDMPKDAYQPAQPGKITETSGKLSELDRHLREAKDAAKRIATVRMTELASIVDAVSMHLKAADDIFRDLASVANLTRLEERKLEVVPVRGVEEEPKTAPEK